MSNTTAMIGGREYVFQGVTDLEVMPLAEVFGAERPEEGTKKYKEWERQFVQKFCEPSGLRVVAMFLRCAFPGIPEETVKYTVRRLPDGTEECRPGIDLWVKISAKEFEQIVLIISGELKKIEQKLSQERKSRRTTFDTGTPNISADSVKRREAAYFVLDNADIEQEKLSPVQQDNSEEIASIVAEVLKQRQLIG